MVIDRLSSSSAGAGHGEWERVRRALVIASDEVNIALVGKYVQLPDAYLSVTKRSTTQASTTTQGERALGRRGVLTPEEVDQVSPRWTGSWFRAVSASEASRARFARPAMPVRTRCALLRHLSRHAGRGAEFARHMAGLDGANSSEFDPVTEHPRHRSDARPARRRRHGRHHAARRVPVQGRSGTKGFAAYGEEVIYERHRHRFEVNNAYRDRLTEAGSSSAG
jgi:CTP synthase